MHFSDYAGAHDYLQKAKAELPSRPGLSRGTALYYLGLALEKLGYRPQAVEAYKAAAEAKDATLIDNDGPGGRPARRAQGGPVSVARLVWREARRRGAVEFPLDGEAARGGPRRGRRASASTSRSSRAGTRASRGAARRGSWSTSTPRTSRG